ncbi:MAG: NAD(P)H-hydrate dehydratase [Chitinophagales bacterium]|nr:NAD(P)H-hydrate dehydratase [Chitinophagales bacterium]MDW8393000.1 NAD(P)H-hydrate dehydratase [Chitinophagales bacterium]
MLPLLDARQIRSVDQATLIEQGISDAELMWRAASLLFRQVKARIRSAGLSHAPVFIFCGPSNNGGDGLVVALHFLEEAIQPVYVFLLSRDGSPSFEHYRKQVEEKLQPVVLGSAADFPQIPSGSIVIDALFGTGLNRPLDGFTAQLVTYLNQSHALRLAIDVPSGLYVDQPCTGPVFSAHHTFTFQLPKLSFLMAENATSVGNWSVVDIGLSRQAIAKANTSYFLLEQQDVASLLKERPRFAHKGHFGHALIVAGSEPTAGAAVLSTQACVRSGAGLTTALIPSALRAVINMTVPEAMTLSRETFSAMQLSRFTAVAAGPGMGTDEAGLQLLNAVLQHRRLVLDADALTLLAQHNLLSQLPPGTVLTPHPKEWERLTEKSTDWLKSLQRQQELSVRHKCMVVRKGAYSCISGPDGRCCFNPTGNSGMAKGGSGDVLTGMIGALLAQGYDPWEAALLGTYVHGLAGDLAVLQTGDIALTPSDLIHHLGQAFRQLKGQHG